MGQDAFNFGHPPDPGHQPPTDQWAPRLARLLSRQHELARALEDLSIRQSAAIDADDAVEILRVVEARDPVVEMMVAVNRELEPFARRDGGLFAGLDAVERAEIEQQVAAVDALIAGVNQRDREDRSRLEAMRAAAAAQLAATRAGTGAVAAYGLPAGTHARFQDREG